VSITLSSYESNLDTVSISWSINGKTLLSGVGKKSFSLNAPALGGTTTVNAAIRLPDGEIDKKITVTPSMLVLLWQADDSYVPPFYKGKALPSPESEVKVVAMPEIKTGSKMIDPLSLVYTWQQDYTNNPSGSGYGKNSFVYVNDYLDSSNNIDVTTSTIDQKYSSEANIDIATYQPKILFYKDDANLGTLWEQALSDGHQVEGAEVIEAAPYFISPKDIRIPTLVWNWSINDSSVANALGFRNDLLPLQTQAGVSGTSKIGLQIRNSDKIFENASKEINVQF
jgi:hypothetical protein